MSPKTAVLTLYTVYFRPRNLPGVEYAVRRTFIGPDPGGMTMDPYVVVYGAGEYELIQQDMEFFGLVCIGRQPDDDPTIIEVWI